MTEPTANHNDGTNRLRVLLVTEDDPLYVIKFFEVFFEKYPAEEFEIVGVTVDDAFHESRIKTARRMLRFYGPIGFVRLLSRFITAKLARRSIERLAREASLPIEPTTSVNDPEYIERIRALRPDVIVSVAAPEIFKKDILESARLGCVNIHSGRLPKYRGMMPNFWQLMNEEPHATITIHEMAAKLDAGAVLATKPVEIRKNDTLDRLIVETKQQGAELMIETLRKLAAGETTPQPLDMSGADYFSFPTPEAVRQLKRVGHSLL